MKIALAVVVLVALLLVADRAGAGYAGRSIADEVRASTPIDSRPEVDITGFPFLTQALSGRYERVEVSATDVPAGDFVLSRLDATLYGAQVPLSDVLAQDVESVPAERVTARALVEYVELSQRYEGQELTVEPEGDRLVLSGDLQGFDQTMQGEALASVEVVEGDIMVTADEVAFGEEGTRQELSEGLREQLNLRVPVGDLPYDLTLTAAEVRPEGMVLSAEGTDVVLTASR